MQCTEIQWGKGEGRAGVWRGREVSKGGGGQGKGGGKGENKVGW